MTISRTVGWVAERAGPTTEDVDGETHGWAKHLTVA